MSKEYSERLQKAENTPRMNTDRTIFEHFTKTQEDAEALEIPNYQYQLPEESYNLFMDPKDLKFADAPQNRTIRRHHSVNPP